MFGLQILTLADRYGIGGIRRYALRAALVRKSRELDMRLSGLQPTLKMRVRYKHAVNLFKFLKCFPNMDSLENALQKRRMDVVYRQFLTIIPEDH